MSLPHRGSLPSTRPSICSIHWTANRFHYKILQHYPENVKEILNRNIKNSQVSAQHNNIQLYSLRGIA